MPVLYRRFQALLAATESPWTRDLRHVKSTIPRFWLKSPQGGPSVSAVKVQNRIKWWNIVPGDQVRVLGSKDTSLREVYAINRLSNRVLLKKERNKDTNTPKALTPTDSVHYSRCQLYIGNHEFPPSEGSIEPRNIPVFAARVGMTTPKWVRAAHRYDWTRFAESTVPRLPGWIPGSKERISIAWPKPSQRPEQKPTEYDTPLEVVAEITYKPAPIPKSYKTRPPKSLSEHDYMKLLSTDEDTTFPVELYLAKELSNPHSRANKQKRWQERQEIKKELLRTMTWQEFDDLKGRTRKEARAEAIWKWKQELEEQRREEIMRKWLGPRLENMRAKKARREKKQERINKKLRALVLDSSSNPASPITSAGRVVS